MLLSDFEPEFIAKIDQYLQEGLIPPVVGGFEVFCSTATIHNYANAYIVTASEMVHVNLEARIHGGCQLCLLISQTRV